MTEPSDLVSSSTTKGGGETLYDSSRALALREYLITGVRHSGALLNMARYIRAIRLAKDDKWILLLQDGDMILPIVVSVRGIHTEVNFLRRIHFHRAYPNSLDGIPVLFIQLPLLMCGDKMQQTMDFLHPQSSLCG